MQLKVDKFRSLVPIIQSKNYALVLSRYAEALNEAVQCIIDTDMGDDPEYTKDSIVKQKDLLEKADRFYLALQAEKDEAMTFLEEFCSGLEDYQEFMGRAGEVRI